MKTINPNNLRHQVTTLYYDNKKDESFGWEHIVIVGDEYWAEVEPIVGRDGYHAENPGGGLASKDGYIKKNIPKYRVMLRSDVDLSRVIGFYWNINGSKKTLMLSHYPFLVQNGEYQCCLTAEEVTP